MGPGSLQLIVISHEPQGVKSAYTRSSTSFDAPGCPLQHEEAGFPGGWNERTKGAIQARACLDRRATYTSPSPSTCERRETFTGPMR
jgi:hypothetical protein